MDSKNNTKSFKVGDKVFFRAYKDDKEMWEDNIIAARIRKLIYMEKGKDFNIKGTIAEKKRLIKDLEEPKKMLYDVFDVGSMTCCDAGTRTSSRKRKHTEELEVDPK